MDLNEDGKPNLKQEDQKQSKNLRNSKGQKGNADNSSSLGADNVGDAIGK